MSNSDKARLKRITAAVLADQSPAADDFAWYQKKRDENPGLRLAAEKALEKGEDCFRTLLQPDTLTAAEVDEDGQLVITLYPDEHPNQTGLADRALCHPERNFL